MNRYDNENTIIRDFQMFSLIKTRFLPNKLKTFIIYFLIHNKFMWKTWIDSSSKKELPPDFYNNTFRLMMDVMRIDDHSYVDKKGRVINPYNKRESEFTKELIKRNKSIKSVADNGNLIIIPYTGVTGEKDHNYNLYINSFKRVVKNT